MKSTYIYTLLTTAALLFIFSCKRNTNTKISFYYWKTTFEINDNEQKLLQHNNVKELYVRYFDIVSNKKTQLPEPRGVIQFLQKRNMQYIPVIFIKNEVFEKLQQNSAIDSLCKNTWMLIDQINRKAGVHIDNIQFDCDWTIKTKDTYFLFLKKFKQLTGLRMSATIRLHQVKYSLKTGIPPVEKGLLMFYNMGKFSSDNTNSIYDAKTSEKYLSHLNTYPLDLDIALPIFSWGIQIRDGQVTQLLNKTNNSQFDNDPHFKKIATNKYTTTASGFSRGYYFKQGDEVKIEKITADDLLTMAAQINKYKSKATETLIFYDLDTFNTRQYEEKIYKTIANCLN